MDPGQSIGGVIAYDVVDRTFEHRPDRTTGTMVHPVSEFEIAKRKFGVVDVIVKCVEFWLVELVVLPDLGIKPLQRAEEVPLVGVIQRLPEVQILQLVT